MDARGMNHAKDLGWMIDASHNVKDPLEDLLQSIDAITLAYTQALLVDRKKLNEAQEENDVVAAQQILQNIFRTDVRAITAEARFRSGGALDPLQFYREGKVRQQLTKERGTKNIATGL
jgi:L-rhamnose isomerase/sugar isomerase